MKNISLKLQEQILSETDTILQHLKTSRNKYINEAINFYNHYQRTKILKAQLEKESKLVRDDSKVVLRDFESLEDEI